MLNFVAGLRRPSVDVDAVVTTYSNQGVTLVVIIPPQTNTVTNHRPPLL